MSRGANRRILAAVLGAVALALGSLGCAALAPQRVATEEEQRAYAAAISEVESDPRDAAKRLEAFIETYPESPLADDAAEQRARIALARGELADAREALGRAVALAPDDPDVRAAWRRLPPE